jgi:hypothetical protein
VAIEGESGHEDTGLLGDAILTWELPHRHHRLKALLALGELGVRGTVDCQVISSISCQGALVERLINDYIFQVEVPGTSTPCEEMRIVNS